MGGCKRTRRERFQRGTKKLLRGDGYVHHLLCGDGFMGVCVCQNLANCIKFVSLIVRQFYFNEAV